ncbi:MAG: hypothetical protein Fur0037_09040 [Planctomycetota bacterium]
MPKGPQTDEAAAAELKERISRLVDAIVSCDEERYEADFVHYLTRARDLVERKLAMEGAKSDTRDLVGELLFSRLRSGMRQFLQTEDARDEIRVSEWVMGSLFSIATLSDFARAFDQVLFQRGSARDFSFAGRTDFISVEEVLQMLASGKHAGSLCLEKADNRLDIYLKAGRMVFLNPHRMIRRVLPSSDPMRYREIPEADVTEAEKKYAAEGRPVLLELSSKFRSEERQELMRTFGKEVLFEFMTEKSPYAFFYRKLDALPEFVEEHDMRLGVTSVLLEGSKRLDDWNQMLQVFPDPDQPIEPKSDMFARMGELALGPIEIKLLTQINGEVTPRQMAGLLGLPLFDVYQLLLQLARNGVVSAPGGDVALANCAMSLEESMADVFAALDAACEGEPLGVLDKVLGSEDEPSGPEAMLDRVLSGTGDDEQERGIRPAFERRRKRR